VVIKVQRKLPQSLRLETFEIHSISFFPENFWELNKNLVKQAHLDVLHSYYFCWRELRSKFDPSWLKHAKWDGADNEVTFDLTAISRLNCDTFRSLIINLTDYTI